MEENPALARFLLLGIKKTWYGQGLTTRMHQLKLQGLNDPFTLLKIIQIFREIAVDDQLAILYENREMLDELFKVLPEGSYQVVTPADDAGSQSRCIVLRKMAAINDRPPSGGCRCQ